MTLSPENTRALLSRLEADGKAVSTRLPHPTTLVLAAPYATADMEQFLRSLPKRFERGEGKLIHDGRNKIRVLEHEGKPLVVKSFRRAHIVNRYVYGTLRATKAKRSFVNARLLQELGIGTPAPVGYFNVRSAAGFSLASSFYVSELSPCEHLYQELFDVDFPYADDVLRAIGRLTAQLHEAGLAHKDYGRANILFRQAASGEVELQLVDLNRMAVGPLSLEAGCKNFERLPATPHMHRLMAETYAEIRGFDAEACFRLMQQFRSTQPGKVDGKW